MGVTPRNDRLATQVQRKLFNVISDQYLQTYGERPMLHEMHGNFPQVGGMAEPDHSHRERPTLLERLKDERDFLTKRLEKVERAINALESNPKFTEMLQIVQEVQ